MVDLEMYYYLVVGDGLGNTLFSDNKSDHLKNIKKLLVEKYGENDYRVKFISLCMLKAETNEFEIQDKEWVRYILHAECDPEDPHTSLLEELKERLEVYSTSNQGEQKK